jgi:hypothetical protein
MWKGGKNNENKLSLVSWGKITKPLLEGGLQIWDLKTQNLALGAQLLWNLVTGKLAWSKQVLCKKYFLGARKKFLDSSLKASKGSPIFTIFQKSLPLFKIDLTWIPGNRKSIRI